MPDAVASRKRQVSMLRSNGSKGAFNKSLYKAGRRRRRESGIRERNFASTLSKCLAPEILGLLFCYDAISDQHVLVRRNLASSFQAWEIRVSEIYASVVFDRISLRRSAPA
jgi:hypothetical protein